MGQGLSGFRQRREAHACKARKRLEKSVWAERLKILCTGSSGFLGSHLVPELKARGHQVYAPSSAECDLTKSGPNSLTRITNRFGHIDRIYHLAAYTQAGDWCLKHPGEQWLVNQKINTNVLNFWQKHAPDAKLVIMGTSCAYDPTLLLTEDNFLKGTPHEDLFTYAMTKRMLVAGAQALSKQYGMKYLCMVPSTLYGPGYRVRADHQPHFIYDLIRKVHMAKRYDEPVVLWGDGYQTRQLTYIDDFVNTMLDLDHVNNEIVNVGGTNGSIRWFAKKVCGILKYDYHKISYDKTAYVGARAKCLNSAKVERLLPNQQKTEFHVGLKRTIENFAR